MITLSMIKASPVYGLAQKKYVVIFSVTTSIYITSMANP
jgi:hypothetical protein